MAIKHAIIKPIRHAGVASQDRIYKSGGAIVEGAPVVFSAGTVVEATDASGGPAPTYLTAGPNQIVGIALNSVTGSGFDVMVALAYQGFRFLGSLTDLGAATGSDGGTHALAIADIGKIAVLHKDGTTLKWVLAGATAANASMIANKQAVVTAGAAGTGTVTYIGQVVITNLIDKIGATTNDSLTFGAVGGQSIGTPPNTTFSQDPTGSNFGTAKVEFMFLNEVTMF